MGDTRQVCYTGNDGLGLGGGDLQPWLSRQFEAQALEQQLEFGFWLGIGRPWRTISELVCLRGLDVARVGDIAASGVAEDSLDLSGGANQESIPAVRRRQLD